MALNNSELPPSKTLLSPYQPILIAVLLFILILKSIQISNYDIIKSLQSVPTYQMNHYKNVFINFSEFESQALKNEQDYIYEDEDIIDQVDLDTFYNDLESGPDGIHDQVLEEPPSDTSIPETGKNVSESIMFNNLLKAKLSENGKDILLPSLASTRPPGGPPQETETLLYENANEQITSHNSKIMATQNDRLELLQNYCQKFKLEHPTNRLKLSPVIRLHKMIYLNKKSGSSLKEPFSYCIPLKTGTTNWQRSFVKNHIPSKVKGKGGKLFLNPPLLFKLLFRVSYIKDYQERLQVLTNETSIHMLRGINVRHPFSRLFSAYHQKFEIKYYKKYLHHYKMYGTKMKQIDSIYEIKDDYSYKYIASFEAFLRLIAKQKLDRYFDAHWKTIRYTCQPCFIRYNFISHTETSTDESVYVLNKVFENPSTESISGPYDHSQHKVRKIFEKLDPNLLAEIYEIYKDDFLMFGYSLDDDY